MTVLFKVDRIAQQGFKRVSQSYIGLLPAANNTASSHSRFISSSPQRLNPPSRPASNEKRNQFEPPRGDIKASLPTQRWSNRTLIMLASLVGASVSGSNGEASQDPHLISSRLTFPWFLVSLSCQTYVLGVNQGYNQGKKQGVLDAQLAMQPPPVVSSRPQADVPAAVMTPM